MLTCAEHNIVDVEPGRFLPFGSEGDQKAAVVDLLVVHALDGAHVLHLECSAMDPARALAETRSGFSALRWNSHTVLKGASGVGRTPSTPPRRRPR
jgi:hypothetical protein